MVRNIAIVSLSAGTIGEDFAKHEVEIGLKRLAAYGVNVKMMPHAQAGIEYVKNHPVKRAEDLIQAFQDDSIDMILCAIGGDDTYRLAPYLFENDALRRVMKPKIFLGFSDSTMNHLMLHRLGLNTFYGQSFLADVCEMEDEMLPYTAHYFGELLRTGRIREVTPSDLWYEERTDWSASAVGTPRVRHPNEGFQLLQGAPVFCGKILGGCLETLYDIFNNDRYPDTVTVCEKYGLFPTLDDWRGKILLLETSEERPSPEHYRRMLEALKRTGIFGAMSGVLCGKPMDEMYFEEYKRIIVEVVDDPALPIVANLNVGHATPRCILPFGVQATVDAVAQRITFDYDCHPAE
ncbi:MAG: LD-carboxypeptidase [Clostridia bacterium]|nr:LD-carboxypeptidase [Clostridia bacterium]